MRSATIEQKPDIVMHIHKNERDITLTYLYDAKYSVRGDDDATLGNIQDEPKPETINAMHHYRDAIYYGKRGEQRFSKEIIGGYILFPGRMDEQRLLEQLQDHDEQLPYFLKSIEEVNIGAYPLLPNEESGLLLENHLRKVLLDESIIEQLEVSVPQRGLYYTRKDLSENLVYVGYVKAENPDIDLFWKNQAKSYYSGNLDFNEVDLQSLKYLFPIVAGKVYGVYEIETIGFKRLSKIRLLKPKEEDNLRVVFTLDGFKPIINRFVSCQNRLHNNKVYSLDEIRSLIESLDNTQELNTLHKRDQ